MSPPVVEAHKYLLNEETNDGEWIHCPAECSGKQGIKRESEIQPETEEGGGGIPSGSCRAVQDAYRAALLTTPGGTICIDYKDIGGSRP